ncbi:unnamed protein product [Effrenium voratum]|nr:unnamed protein product [Effrenium voratum]
MRNAKSVTEDQNICFASPEMSKYHQSTPEWGPKTKPSFRFRCACPAFASGSMSGDSPREIQQTRAVEVQDSALLLSAAFAVLSCGALCSGYSALVPSLLEDGAFHEDCLEEEVCSKQMSDLTHMYTVANSLLNLAALPTGLCLDHFGYGRCGLCAALAIALGAVLFSLGGPGPGRAAYTTGFSMMAIFGPVMSCAGYTFAQRALGHRGIFIAAFAACAEMCPLLFATMAWMSDLGTPLPVTFRLFALLPLLVSLLAVTLWPHRGDSEEQKTLLATHEAHEELQELCSLEFAFLTHAKSVSTLAMSFFMGTLYSQLSVATDVSGARMLNRGFAFLLPLGGVLAAPVAALVVDYLGPTSAYLLFCLCYSLFSLCFTAFLHGQGVGWALASFLLFGLSRPLYSVSMVGVAGKKGGVNWGSTIWGMPTAIAGLCCFLVTPLADLGRNGSFGRLNAWLLLLQLSSLLLAIPMLRKELGSGAAKPLRLAYSEA